MRLRPTSEGDGPHPTNSWAMAQTSNKVCRRTLHARLAGFAPQTRLPALRLVFGPVSFEFDSCLPAQSQTHLCWLIKRFSASSFVMVACPNEAFRSKQDTRVDRIGAFLLLALRGTFTFLVFTVYQSFLTAVTLVFINETCHMIDERLRHENSKQDLINSPTSTSRTLYLSGGS